MIRKDEIRAEIARLEERKRELIEEAKSLPSTPVETIEYHFKARGHRVFTIIKQAGSAVHVHAIINDDLSTITDKIFKETKHSLIGFKIQPDGSYYIWFKRLA